MRPLAIALAKKAMRWLLNAAEAEAMKEIQRHQLGKIADQIVDKIPRKLPWE